ncbi:hypothetical protein C7E12_23290, partial [Stenotrophomonas maltophilia]
MAFTRQADTEDVDAPVLLRTSPLTFIDSVLLLYLSRRGVHPPGRYRRRRCAGAAAHLAADLHRLGAAA